MDSPAVCNVQMAMIGSELEPAPIGTVFLVASGKDREPADGQLSLQTASESWNCGDSQTYFQGNVWYGTDWASAGCDHYYMYAAPDVRVVDAERVGEGVIVEFDDGECALYSATLLRSLLLQAVKVEEGELND
jgi:hypothetical protein